MSLEIYFHGSYRHAISVIFEELEETQEQKKHLAQNVKRLIENKGTRNLQAFGNLYGPRNGKRYRQRC